jgi:hypothetical protein
MELILVKLTGKFVVFRFIDILLLNILLLLQSWRSSISLASNYSHNVFIKSFTAVIIPRFLSWMLAHLESNRKRILRQSTVKNPRTNIFILWSKSVASFQNTCLIILRLVLKIFIHFTVLFVEHFGRKSPLAVRVPLKSLALSSLLGEPALRRWNTKL